MGEILSKGDFEINQYKVTGILDTLNLLQATASTIMATRPVFSDWEKTKNSLPYENLPTWSILQLSAIAFAGLVDMLLIISKTWKGSHVSKTHRFLPTPCVNQYNGRIDVMALYWLKQRAELFA